MGTKFPPWWRVFATAVEVARAGSGETSTSQRESTEVRCARSTVRGGSFSVVPAVASFGRSVTSHSHSLSLSRNTVLLSIATDRLSLPGLLSLRRAVVYTLLTRAKSDGCSRDALCSSPRRVASGRVASGRVAAYPRVDRSAAQGVLADEDGLDPKRGVDFFSLSLFLFFLLSP